jgi:hypothetical protein
LRAIARQLGRAPSTINPEVRRNGGSDRYRAAASDQAAQFGDALEALAKMFAAHELVHDAGAVDEDQGVADGVMRGPDLHVRTVEGVADVDWVVEQDRCAIAPAQLLADTPEAAAPGGQQGL